MSFDWHKREEHYAKLKTRLESLRQVFPAVKNYSSLFDEFITEFEFGLALETLCDFLLEPDVRPVSEAELEEIASLHKLMEVEDRCVLKLKKKRQDFEKAHGR